MINRDNVMMLELIQGVSDSMLQKRLLMEQEPTLSKLAWIAEQWQASDRVQTTLGTESEEYDWKLLECKHPKAED